MAVYIIETERLALRQMTDDDLGALRKMLQDEDVMRYYGHTYSDNEVAQWMARQQARYAQDCFGLWAAVLKASGEMIGQCGLTWQQWGEKRVLEIGYLFQKAYWHRGYATEAARTCKAHAFSELDAQRVYSIIHEDNTPSQRVAERNGMTEVGRFTKFHDGLHMPHIVFGVER